MNTFPIFEVPFEFRDHLRAYMNHHLLGEHDYGGAKGPLSHGRTFYFREVNPNVMPFVSVMKHHDAQLEAWIKQVLEGTLVKMYFHQLNPNERIDSHHDALPYFSYVRRYQITLDLPDGFVLTQPRSLLKPWHVHRFVPHAVHAYRNTSTSPVGLFVIDVTEPGCLSHFVTS